MGDDFFEEKHHRNERLRFILSRGDFIEETFQVVFSPILWGEDVDQNVTQIDGDPVSALIDVQKLLFRFKPFFQMIQKGKGMALSQRRCDNNVIGEIVAPFEIEYFDRLGFVLIEDMTDFFNT